MSELPNNWVLAPLPHIATINPTLDKSCFQDELEVSFVPMPSVEAETGKIDVSQTKTFAEVKKGYTPFCKDDVLFAKITPCMENGKMAVVPKLHNDVGFGSTEFHVLRAKQGIEPQYLYYYVSSKSYRYNAEHNMTGAVGQKRVPTAHLEKSFVSLPPTNEQKRIVAKIEELFSELDKGIENLKTAREQLKVYRQVLLDQASTGELLVVLGIEKKPFDETQKITLDKVVKELGQGWSPKCHNHPSDSENKWGVIKTTAIQPLVFDGSENKELPENLQPRPHLEILPGDILVTRAGPRKRVGVTCLVRKCRRKLMICDKVYRLRPDTTKILSEYLEMVLNTPKTIWEIEELKTGINDSGVNLTQNRFLELKIFVPSVAKQKITLAELEGSLSKIEHLERQIDESLSISESLRQSILKRAFSGRLVAQDPKDEPASVLLERIKAEKHESSKRKKKVA